MDAITKLNEGTYSFQTKGVEYIVTLKRNDTRTIQIFDQTLIPVPMTDIEVWDKIESGMYDYIDSLVN